MPLAELWWGWKSAMLRKIFWIYGGGGVLTFIFQIIVRLHECSGESCYGFLGKAIVWSCIWPVAWLVYYRILHF